MQFMRGMLFGLIIGIGVTLFFTLSPPGRDLVRRAVDSATGLIQRAPEAAQSAVRGVSIDDLLAGVEDAARRAEDLAAAVAGDVSLAELADRLEAAAREAGASAGALAIRAQELALEAAAAIPDLETLGGTLSGWQEELAAYEMAMRADDVDDADAEVSEREIAAAFAARTRAAPAALPADAAPGAAPPFEPHAPLYTCPVIAVSNSGPVNSERVLTRYTPWVDSPAGVLIRAPVEAGCLSSGYGTRMVDGASRNHAGVDYYNRDGGEIYAAGDGVVTLAGEDGAYGQAVRIDHGEGVEGLYAHMVPGSLRVRAGDRVRLGQPIGAMGRSGRAYAVHLHYELRFADTTVDPLYEGRRESY